MGEHPLPAAVLLFKGSPIRQHHADPVKLCDRTPAVSLDAVQRICIKQALIVRSPYAKSEAAGLCCNVTFLLPTQADHMELDLLMQALSVSLFYAQSSIMRLTPIERRL